MLKVRYLLILFLLVFFQLSYAFTVRYALHKNEGFFRVVFQTDKEVAWKEKPYPKDKILVITIEDIDREEVKDLKNTLEKALKEYVKKVDIITRGRTLKIVIKFKKTAPGYKIYSLKSPYRIVLDIVISPEEEEKEELYLTPDYSKKKNKKDVIAEIIKKKSSTAKTVKKVNKLKSNSKKVSAKSKKIKVENRVAKKRAVRVKVSKKTVKRHKLRSIKRRNRKIVIVLDPGHGGKDPGATANGLKEKDITLKIAKRLKYYLEKDGRFKVYLTRNRDKFVPLYKRSLFAVQKNADMFISIHCNALPKNKTFTGTYVYTLNLRGARSKMAKIVEKRENKVVMKYVRVSANNYVNRIVADLAVSSTMTEGRKFSKYLRKYLKRITKFRKVDSANFAVLKTPGIPSVLIETLFITTPKDAKKLKSWHYRDKFSYYVYLAIVDYFF